VLLAAAGCGGAAGRPLEAPVAQGSQAPGARAYAIHLWQPSHVGQRWHLVVESDEERETTTEHPGAVVDIQREKKVLHLDAVITVVATNEARNETRAAYDVAELTSNGESLLRGAIDVTRAPTEAEATVLAAGEPVAKDVRDALKAMVSLRVGGPNDDEVFGSSEPRAVGAHWPIDARLAQEDLAATGVQCAAVSGDATLVSVTRVENADALEVHSDLRLTGLQVPGLPAGSAIERGDVTAEGSWVVPVVGASSSHENMTYRTVLKVRVPTPQGDAVVTSTITNRKDARLVQL
jgi:hypothetical protein